MTTPATRSAPSEQTDGGFTHRQIVMILVGLMMGMFLAALDQTVVSTAIRTIADDLNGFSLQAWATTAFLITSTISTPLYGKLSDIYGRKPFFLFAIVDLHRRLGALRPVPLDVRAGRVPGDPGHRRRRPVLDGAGDHRRHRAAPAAGPLPGLLPRRVRHVQRARPGARRPVRRRRHHPRASPAGAGSSTSTCRSGWPRWSWSTGCCTSRTPGATTASTGPARSR